MEFNSKTAVEVVHAWWESESKKNTIFVNSEKHLQSDAFIYVFVHFVT